MYVIYLFLEVNEDHTIVVYGQMTKNIEPNEGVFFFPMTVYAHIITEQSVMQAYSQPGVDDLAQSNIMHG